MSDINSLNRPKFHLESGINLGKYVFLTGATGTLGAYFLRELLVRNYPVAVLVRPSRTKTAAQRVDAQLALWESENDRLPRPVVIEGDLSGNGWLEEKKDWFRANVDSVIHSAASLEFYGKRNAEPYTTNISGIQTILDLCRLADIRKFHHVSTAYVAGSKPYFCESECNVGQKFRNDYEQSKIEAEMLVRNFGFDSLTVYRPSIVIGDTKNGYTPTLSGLYAVLKLVHTLVSRVSLGSTSARLALATVGMCGKEYKNLVPVNWVAGVFAHIFSHEELHGKTYHLTSPNPPHIHEVAKAIQDAVEKYSEMVPESDKTKCDQDWFHTNFMGQMRLFRAYTQEDPQFDSSNTISAAPHLPCPTVDHELLMFLFHKVIESHFGKRWHLQNP